MTYVKKSLKLDRIWYEPRATESPSNECNYSCSLIPENGWFESLLYATLQWEALYRLRVRMNIIMLLLYWTNMMDVVMHNTVILDRFMYALQTIQKVVESIEWLHEGISMSLKKPAEWAYCMSQRHKRTTTANSGKSYGVKNMQ